MLGQVNKSGNKREKKLKKSNIKRGEIIYGDIKY